MRSHVGGAPASVGKRAMIGTHTEEVGIYLVGYGRKGKGEKRRWVRTETEAEREREEGERGEVGRKERGRR